MVKKPITVLHLASLEEARTKKEKPDSLGINQGQAYAWSRTRMGGWAVAQSPILGTTITVKRLKVKGYVSLTTYYKR